MTPRLSIIVPVYNEERTLPTLMARLQKACGDIAEFIYVDDGSKDRSPQILKENARPQDLILTKKNGGKGSAVHLGYGHAKGTFTIVQDADLEYSPEEIPMLLAAAEASPDCAIFGSRRLKKQRQYAHAVFFFGGNALTWICNVLYGTHLTDQPTCYKLVRTDVIRTLPLKENDFRFDPELTSYLALSGITIKELPISYLPRSRAEGKKICWKDWFKWVWVFVTVRFKRLPAFVPAPKG